MMIKVGILGYEKRPLVSIDYRTNPRSSIIDAWYYNEWGCANRTVERAKLVGLAG